MFEFLTTNVYYYTIAHQLNYNEDEIFVGVITKDKLIKIVKIILNKKENEWLIDIYQFLPEILKKNFHRLKFNRIDLILVDTDKFTIFLQIFLNEKQYVYQINCFKNNILEFIPLVDFYLNKNRIYLGLSDTKKVIYKNNEEIEIPLKGLLYFEQNKGNNFIRQIKLYTTMEEKQLLQKEGKILNYNEYPILDKWSNIHPVVTALPNTSSVKQFDSSVGLGIIKFVEGE